MSFEQQNRVNEEQEELFSNEELTENNNPSESDENHQNANDEPLAQQQSSEADTTPKQLPQDNAKFAAKRREDERRAEQENIRLQTFKQTMGGMQNPNTGKPFETVEEWNSFKNDLTLKQQAQAFEMSKEKYTALTAQLRENILQNDPEIIALKAREESLNQMANEAIYAKDLADIKAMYPDEKAASIDDLGDNFGKMRCLGVDVITAYEAVRNSKMQRGAKMPPSTGDISSASIANKDFFTSDEVDAMSKKEVEKHYETIRKSIAKW